MEAHGQDGTIRNDAHVLIVSDQPDTAELVESHLRVEGMFATKCLDHRTAMSTLQHGDFDLMIIDLMLPGVDGHEVFKLVRTLGRTRTMPVIFLVAPRAREGVALKADLCIAEPFSGASIVRKVRALLESADPPRR